MPKTVIDQNNCSYYRYKITFDDNSENKYYTTSKQIIKDFPTLTKRIIYKYVCKNHVPKERRRKKTLQRGIWIDKCRIRIIRNNEQILRV
tara:strand:+ start:256 stop:525 length:270 start_codon:yes stop_codon:yes gene_type:complete